jgi:CspA family cold shock protein
MRNISPWRGSRKVVHGTVKKRDDEEGWGVLVSPDLPGEVFAHHVHIRGQDGYRMFAAGDPVVFEADEQGQDGCQYSARWVQRLADI